MHCVTLITQALRLWCWFVNYYLMSSLSRCIIRLKSHECDTDMSSLMIYLPRYIKNLTGGHQANLSFQLAMSVILSSTLRCHSMITFLFLYHLLTRVTRLDRFDHTYFLDGSESVSILMIYEEAGVRRVISWHSRYRSVTCPHHYVTEYTEMISSVSSQIS